MSGRQLESIASNKQFRQMVRHRHRMAWALSCIVLAINAVYVVSMSFLPGLFARTGHEGEHVPNGISYYLWMIVVGISLPAYYSWWCNKYFDPMRKQLLASLTTRAERGKDE